ncbi:MAG TPA: helix-turn-helix domain-containing protein [Candidatus Dormibacteraeota bacterium]
MSEVSVHASAPARRRGRRRGIEIRPGSVKEARRESGLSLGQIARTDLSRTAIYFVETGKAKPSIETLRLIAERTNKPLEFFLDHGRAAGLDPGSALAEMERLLSIGDPAGAAQAAGELIAASSDPRSVACARINLALAELRLGHPVRARTEAAAARVYFTQAKDVHMAALAMGYEAGAAGNMLDPSALSIAKEALALCRSMSPVPEMLEARLLMIVGHAYTQAHEYADAIQALEQSIGIGAAIQDLHQLSLVYSHLSLNNQELGRFAEAARYAHRAMAIHETLQDQRSLAFAENNLSLLVYKQGDLAGALRHAESSLARFDELGYEEGKANVLMTLAEFELARSNHDVATDYAREARELAEHSGVSANVAEARMWHGRILEAQGDRAAADAEFEGALNLLDQLGVAERITRNRAVYADVLEARGDLAGANRQLRVALGAVRPGSVLFLDARTATA